MCPSEVFPPSEASGRSPRLLHRVKRHPTPPGDRKEEAKRGGIDWKDMGRKREQEGTIMTRVPGWQAWVKQGRNSPSRDIGGPSFREVRGLSSKNTGICFVLRCTPSTFNSTRHIVGAQ